MRATTAVPPAAPPGAGTPVPPGAAAAGAAGASPAAPPGPARRRSRSHLVLVATALVVVLAAVGVAAVPSGEGAPPPRPAPAFSLDDVRRPGTVVSLEEWRGRPVVVNFFAAWCVPCRKELGVLEAAHRRAGGAIAFVGVDVADSRSAASDLLDATGVTFPAGYDPDKVVAGRYGVQGLPTTVFVDAAGLVVGVEKGELNEAALRRWTGRLAQGRGVGTGEPRGEG